MAIKDHIVIQLLNLKKHKILINYIGNFYDKLILYIILFFKII